MDKSNMNEVTDAIIISERVSHRALACIFQMTWDRRLSNKCKNDQVENKSESSFLFRKKPDLKEERLEKATNQNVMRQPT